MSRSARRLRPDLEGALWRDRPALAKAFKRNPDDERATQRLALSRALAEARTQLPLRIQYPEELPVSAERERLLDLIRDNQVVVVCGATGSGKSTQLPKFCLELGRGVLGRVAHTQPRRVAARTIAARLAEEMNCEVGDAVGYKIRFQDRSRPESRIKVLTDGMLLAELAQDRWLREYDTIILDEAHERSLNIDFLLGCLKRILKRRPELKLIVTSATIDPERFAEFFDDAPIIEVSGRSYPVEIRYRPLTDADRDSESLSLLDGVIAAADELLAEDPGDILVFLPTERDIRDCHLKLRRRDYPDTDILPLFARLSQAEQNKVFHPGPRRRIVLATNVAETSLTVPRIRYVIDSGLARISRYSVRTKVQRLPIEKISRASAEQRSGRCGRVMPGTCIRLYSEEDFLQRSEFTDPEILRTNLAGVILQMQLLRLGGIEDFPFIQAPDQRLVNDGYRLLFELQAVDAERRLTKLGRELAGLPVDPRYGRILLAGREHKCAAEATCIVAALTAQDPRERPRDATEAADQAHARFEDKRSDFLGLLKLHAAWRKAVSDLSGSKLRKWCREHFLSYVRLREWDDLLRQLKAEMQRLGASWSNDPAGYPALHRALLTGLLDHIGQKDDKRFVGTRAREFFVFPGSALSGKPPKWLIAAELVETSRTWGRICAGIQPEWIERAARHLVQRDYGDPHWEPRSGRVGAYEKVSLQGLVLIPGRRVNFARIDAPRAREIFLRDGLVAGELPEQPAFVQQNLDVEAEVRQTEARLRSPDLLADLDTRAEWYAQRLPPDVVDYPSLRRWLKSTGAEARKALEWSVPDIRTRDPGAVDERLWPSHLMVGGQPLALDYQFDPGREVDGVVLEVPAAMLDQVSEQRLDWLVPGLLEDKLKSLIRSLPKALRRNFVPAPEFARAASERLAFAEGDLRHELGRALQQMTGVEVPYEAWNAEALEPHLHMGVRVLDDSDAVLAEGIDLHALRQRFADRVRKTVSRAESEAWPKRMTLDWDFAEIPAEVDVNRLTLFPALRDRGDAGVEQVLCGSREEADAVTRDGLFRLYRVALRQRYRYLQRQLPERDALCRAFKPFGGCQVLTEDILDAALLDALGRDGLEVRTREAFASRVEAADRSLVANAQRISDGLLPALQAAQRLQRTLSSALTPALLEAVRDLREQLDGLIYPGFVAATPSVWRTELPRYLDAMRQRLDKLKDGDSRDRALQQEARDAEQAWRALAERRPGLAEAAAFREHRWWLEEFRVSLFAQGLGTRFKISARRLARHLEEIQTAV